MKAKLLPFLAFTLLVTGCNSPNETFWPAEKSPELISKRVTEDLLSRPDFMKINASYYWGVHYAEACTAFGAARLAGFLSDSTTINRLVERYTRAIEDSIENTGNHVDVNVYGIVPLELFMQTGDSVFFRQGMDLALCQWEDPRPDGLSQQSRFWIDDVWMIGSLQIQAYRATGDPVFLDRAAVTIVAYLDKLQQPNGLFFHGEPAPFHWGRGNGWVAAGLAEIISELPEEHPQYPALEDGYKKMMYALLTYQSEDGMWRQLIDNESAWKESSCTGMFGYAMTVGVKMGILPEKEFWPACQKAWLALTNYITEDGLVEDVCIGTGQSKDEDFYLERPTITGDFHGQAPVLWFAYELLQD